MPSFKLDENLPTSAAELMRESGFDAVSVLDQKMNGTPDPELASVCRDEGRAIVTLDLDFSNIKAYPPADYPGIIVLRLGQQDIPHVLGVIRQVITLLQTEPLDGRLWIVNETGVRIAGDPS